MYKLFAPILYILFFIIPLEAEFISVFPTPDKSIESEEIRSQIKSKELYLKYTKYPKTIYTNQRFSVELEARVLTPKDKYDAIFTIYENEKNIELLDSNVTWTIKDENLYTTKITFKVKDKDFRLPDITVSIEKSTTIEQNISIKNNNTYSQDWDSSDEDTYEDEEYTIETKDLIVYNSVDSITIIPPIITYNNIAVNQKKFSNIIANDLKIKQIQTKQYNNSMLMVVFNIEATNSNLEEFYLSQFTEQGIKNFEENNMVQSMFYYVLIPSHINNIRFNYYNPINTTFINVELPIMLEDDLVSTQTNLNPNDGNLVIYKIVATGVLLILLLLLYLKTFNRFLIVFIFGFIYIFISLLLPNEKITLKANTKIYILPTNLSTVYKITNQEITVEVLHEKNNFKKVLLKNKNIGWIKERDVR